MLGRVRRVVEVKIIRVHPKDRNVFAMPYPL